MFRLATAVLLVGIFLFPSYVFSHGGGLDSQGGHYNRNTGGYHFHRKVSAPTYNKPTKVYKSDEQSIALYHGNVDSYIFHVSCSWS